MKARPSWKSIRKTMKLHWHERRLRWRLPLRKVRISTCHIFRRYVKPIEIRSLGYQKRGSYGRAAEKQAAAAHARILEAQAENVKAQDDVIRYHLLLAKEEIPKQTYDHAYAAAATDTAAVAAAGS